MKKALLIPVTVAFSFAACTPADTTNTGNMSSSSDSSSIVIEISSASSEASSSSSVAVSQPTSTTSSVAAAASSAPAQAKVVSMTVENWKFSQTQVNFAAGDTATIRLTNLTGIHGFAVNDLGINIRINPGETKDIVIPTDKPGTYTFYCSVPCGPGHKDMKGTIVIS